MLGPRRAARVCRTWNSCGCWSASKPTSVVSGASRDRIREAGFRESKTLADFDWQFNAAIDRVRIEALAAAEFIGRRENLVLVGQSGVGKSRIIEAIGQHACVLGYRVRYTTSADLLADLTAALADQTLPRRLR